MKRIRIFIAALAVSTSVVGLSAAFGLSAVHAQGAAKTQRAAKTQMAVTKNAAHLATFDALDYDVYTRQKWSRLHESHAKNVIVHWPDGHQTQGIEKHIQDLKAQFAYIPDTRIQEHTIKMATSSASGSRAKYFANGRFKIEKTAVGSGDWTCVTGVMRGTFTKPMHLPDGKVVQPTGKAFTLPMCSVGRWKNGVMVEEWLYWDNLTFMKQIGLN